MECPIECSMEGSIQSSLESAMEPPMEGSMKGSMEGSIACSTECSTQCSLTGLESYSAADVPLPPDSLPSRKRNAGSCGCSNMLAGMQAGDSMGGCSYGLLHIGIADGMSIARDGACRYSK